MFKTKVMGIINITPDSFYQNSRSSCDETALLAALKMQKEGADILDIGGESTRPGARVVSEQEELDRVIPAVEAIAKEVDLPISIDTSKPNVAREALKAGAYMINDVSGFENPLMTTLAKESNSEICIMHMLGTPQTMQINPNYDKGVFPCLIEWFENKIQSLLKSGINRDKIILDPGIGFGKTVEDNLEIIHNLHKLKRLGFPILLGASRKSFLGKILNKPTDELLFATLAVNAVAVSSKVDIIRVHDVKQHRDLVDVIARIQ